MKPEDLIKQIIFVTDKFIKELEMITSGICSSSSVGNEGFKVTWSKDAKDKGKK